MTNNEPHSANMPAGPGPDGQAPRAYPLDPAQAADFRGAAPGAVPNMYAGPEQQPNPAEVRRDELIRRFSLGDSNENRALKLLTSLKNNSFDNNKIRYEVLPWVQRQFPNPNDWAYDLRGMLSNYTADPGGFLEKVNRQARFDGSPSERTSEQRLSQWRADVVSNFFTPRPKHIDGPPPTIQEQVMDLSSAFDEMAELIYGREEWDRFSIENDFDFIASTRADRDAALGERPHVDRQMRQESLPDQADRNLEMIELNPGGIVELAKNVEDSPDIRRRLGEGSQVIGYVIIDDQSFAVAELAEAGGQHGQVHTAIVPISDGHWHVSHSFMLPGVGEGATGRVSLNHLFTTDGQNGPQSEAESRAAVFLMYKEGNLAVRNGIDSPHRVVVSAGNLIPVNNRHKGVYNTGDQDVFSTGDFVRQND